MGQGSNHFVRTLSGSPLKKHIKVWYNSLNAKSPQAKNTLSLPPKSSKVHYTIKQMDRKGGLFGIWICLYVCVCAYPRAVENDTSYVFEYYPPLKKSRENHPPILNLLSNVPATAAESAEPETTLNGLYL